MHNFLKKLFFINILAVTSAIFLSAETTVCYKENWNSVSTIENIKLEGGECQGKYSLNEMKNQGWNVKDIKIEQNQDNLTYSYLLSKGETTEKRKKKKEIELNKRFSLRPIGVKIDNLENNKTIINIGNLKLGQSGIVVHIIDKDKKLILANAEVIKSNEKTSIIKFTKYDDLKQDALPTSNREVQIGDILVLNYLYTESLVIAPNQESFQIVRDGFKHNNFLHTDVFATRLKIDKNPYPTKKDIQKFAIKQNLGTIFIVVNKKIYVLDTKSFKVLTTFDYDYDTKNTQKPFYTRIEKIEKPTFSFSIFDSEKDISYEDFYKKILGL